MLGAMLGVDVCQRVDRRQYTVPDRGPERRAEAVDRAVQPVTVGRRRHQDLGPGREHDDPPPRAARLVVDERRAPVRAADRRLGRTSLEHIDRDTSMVSMIEVSLGRSPPVPADAPSPPPARLPRPGDRGHAPPPPRPLGHACLIRRGSAYVTASLRRRRLSRRYAASMASGTSSPRQRVRPEEPHASIARPYQRSESPAAIRKRAS